MQHANDEMMILNRATGKRSKRQPLDWIGLRLLVVGNRYAQALYADIKREHQLLRDEVAVIICVFSANGPTAQEIVKFTARPKNSVSRAVRKLEDGGILRRVADIRDGRAAKLYLSARGQAIFERIRGYVAARDERLLGVLSDKEKHVFNRLLTNISDSETDWTSD